MEIPAVLVADDSEDDRYLLGEAAAEACPGRAIRMVESGSRLLDYLRGAGEYADRRAFPEPRLVLLDLKMPGKDGFQTLAELRKLERWRRLPVVVFSASSQPQDLERAYDLGANGYLVKPSTLSELTEMMKAVETYWLRFNRAP